MPGIAAVRRAFAPSPFVLSAFRSFLPFPAPSSRADTLRPSPARWATAAFFAFAAFRRPTRLLCAAMGGARLLPQELLSR